MPKRISLDHRAPPVFAKIKAKQVAGTWTYTVQVPDGDLTGSLEFTKEKKGKLSGKVISNTGDTYTMLKVEIKDGDVVYFEIQSVPGSIGLMNHHRYNL